MLQIFPMVLGLRDDRCVPSPASQPTPQTRPWTALVLPVLLGLLIPLLSLSPWATLPAQATSIYQLPAAPTEATWVVDEPQVLSRLSAGQIRDDLKAIAQETGTDVRFVIISRVEYGQTIQGFIDELFETWYPTPALQRNKVLVGIDVLSNGTAIRFGDQVGLDEATAASIANTTLAFPARDGGRYNQALYDTQSRLGAILAGRPDPGEPQIAEETLSNVESTYATAEETQGSNATTIVIVVLVVATVAPMATYLIYALR